MFRRRFGSLCIACALLVPLEAGASPRTVFNFGLNGSLWGNDVSSSFQFEQDRLSALNLNLSGTGLRADAGDISAHWDELGFAGRSFRGLSLGIPTGKIETTVLGGAVSLFDAQGRQQTSSLYGLRAALPFGKGFRLSASQLWTPGALRNESQGLNTLALAFQPTTRQKVALEVARSAGGSGWQLSWAAQSKQLSLQTSYRQVDRGFSTLGNPLLRTNRSGYFANLRYRVARPLTLSANSQRYENSEGGQSQFNGLSLQLAPRHLPALTLFWQTSAGAPAASLLLTPDEAQTRSQSVGARLSQSLGSTSLSLGLERLRFEGAARDGSETNRFSLGVVRPIGKTLLSLGYVGDFSNANGQAGAASRFAEVHLNRRLGKSGLNLDFGLQHLEDRSAGRSGQSLATRVGFSLPLAGGSSFGAAYRTNLSAGGSLRGGAIPALYLSYSRGFQIGGRRRAANVPESEKARLGAVVGCVFEDKNGDGKWQPEEPLVPDVALAVRNDSKAQTNENGRYALKELRPGNYQLQLVMKTLPIEFTSIAPSQVPLQVVPGKTVAVDFPVVRTGQIEGTVFHDDNDNGARDEGEAGVSDAIVRAEGSDIISFSDKEGRFTLVGLPPRQWKITLDNASLGDEDDDAPAPISAQINVPAGARIKGAMLALATREREVVSSFEKSQ